MQLYNYSHLLRIHLIAQLYIFVHAGYKSLDALVRSCDNSDRTMAEIVVEFMSLPGGIFELYAQASTTDVLRIHCSIW